jgi:uncharacterized membrane protein YfcA
VILAAALSVVMGLALGLLGGGGSILTVPILVYALGLPAKEAIATSLLVVGVTSAVAAASHARAGRVRWRTALAFGSAAMAGAFAGGRLASFISPETLLALFGGVMLATAVAMLRPLRVARGEPRLARIVLDGLVVGGVTGLVGAGGGFLVTPALVLFGGLPMPIAVGTSLAVIAMKSLAGLAGYLGHVRIDLSLASVVTLAAVGGSLVGARLSSRISAASLRRGFALFVIAMALFVLAAQLPAGAFAAIFVERWPWWVGGAALAAFVLTLLLVENKLLGVSTGFAELCAVRGDAAARRSWRLPFLGGIVLGGLLAAAAAGHPATAGVSAAQVPMLLAGGVMVGWGARAAGGCTSGHGIVGTALVAPASLLATALFLAGGFAVTLLGGLP